MTKRRSPNAALWGQRIRTARKAKGLSQVVLANHLGVAQTSICRWEAGHTSPSDIYRGPLAHALGVDPAWLFAHEHPNGDEAAA